MPSTVLTFPSLFATIAMLVACSIPAHQPESTAALASVAVRQTTDERERAWAAATSSVAEFTDEQEKSGAPSAPSVASLVDPIFAAFDRPDAPGCAVGIVRDGELVYARGYGLANLEFSQANGPATVFDAGALARQFTAACIAMLEAEGKLTLDDDVRKYVPELPDYGAKITIRNLLHHTSGLRDYVTLFMLKGIPKADVATEAETLALLVKQKDRNFAPGKAQLESHTGYFLLAVIVERVAQTSFAEFAKSRIFDPLGMKNTHVHDDHSRVVPLRATGYSPTSAGKFVTNISNFEQAGDGALMTTIDDLERWDRNFTTHKVGGEALVHRLLERGQLQDGTDLDYAAGLEIGTYRGLATARHDGRWVGYRSHYLRFVDQRFSVIVLGNRSDVEAGSLTEKVADALLGAELGARTDAKEPTPAGGGMVNAAAPKPAPVASDAAPVTVESLQGVYHSPEIDCDYEIVVKDGRLQCLVAGGAAIELEQVQTDVFRLALDVPATLHFRRDARSAAIAFTVETDPVSKLEFIKRG